MVLNVSALACPSFMSMGDANVWLVFSEKTKQQLMACKLLHCSVKIMTSCANVNPHAGRWSVKGNMFKTLSY